MKMSCFKYSVTPTGMNSNYISIVSYLALCVLLLIDISTKAEGSVCLNASAKDLLVHEDVWTSTSGRPFGDLWNTVTVGPRGPVLLEDLQYIEGAAEFNRRRTLERVAHPKGNGAFGYFEVTDDITRYTKAKVFAEIGKKTPIALRLSLSFGARGSADTVREPRGFAIKFYTEEGNLDLVGLNTPIFFARDPMVVVNIGKVLETDPVTGLALTPVNFWRFLALIPEAMPIVVLGFSSKGIPQSYRHMDGFPINTFKLINAEGETYFCRFNFLTDQGIRNMTRERARIVAGLDPNFHGRDLYRAIERGNFPSWTLFLQVMTKQQTKEVSFNPFDATKEWPQAEFPLIQAGRIVLNKNPTNFNQVEQLALCPSNLVPGIEPSPDKILQGRMLAYPDAQRHRLGVNFHRIPVNSPLKSQRTGGKTDFLEDTGGGKSRRTVSMLRRFRNRAALPTPYDVCGVAKKHDSSDEDNFSQASIYYKNFDETEKNILVENILEALSMASSVPEEIFDYFQQVDSELGRRILEGFQKTDADE